MSLRWRTLCAGLALLVVGCGVSLTLVSFQITRDPDEDPFPGATDVLVAVRQDGVALPRAVARTSLARGTFDTPTVPFGAGYTLRVDVLDGELLLARGTSVAFAVSSAGDESLPPVFVAPLGRFASVATRSAPVPVAAALAGERVVLGNADGSVSALALSDSSTEQQVAPAAGRRFVSLPGGLLAVAASEALFVDDEVHVNNDPSLARHGADALLVPVLPGDASEPCAYIVGGRSAPRALTRLCVTGGVLSATAQPDLGQGGWGGLGAYVTLAGDERRIAWVAREDAGGVSTALTVLNPDAPAEVASAALDLPTTGAVVVPHGMGELLVIGGRTQGGVVLDQVARVVLQTGAGSPAVRAAPSPEPLFSARQGARASWVADGIYLVYGGTNASGVPVPRAELVDVRSFPGSVAPTGQLPTADPLVVLPIDDHAQLAVSAAGVWRYASPRGFQ
ncbi:MAG: hypothetical protein H6725_15190 [Sandaracinaceae bacterium]|nr:hypothetical protein [Sandaracinaceae bacterium]